LGAGLAVPDWPTTFGYNMFLYPWSKMIGGIFYEHTHRLVATCLGVLVVALTRWLGGSRSRLPLAIVGGLELIGGLALLKLAPNLQGAGHFLSGIGGVVLLAALVWARDEPAANPLPMLGWIAFAGVQIQGLLGGLRVVLFKDEIGIFHATLAQLFFVLMCAIVLLTRKKVSRVTGQWQGLPGRGLGVEFQISRTAGHMLFAATGFILFQLILGATMRHQHAGLAIPDFPLAYGRIWPAMDPASVELYNQRRLEVVAVKPITAFQIELQMLHRMIAIIILGMVGACAWALRKTGLSKWAWMWLGMILAQATLGAATILTDKAADVATAHVLLGALSLAMGAVVSVVAGISGFEAPNSKLQAPEKLRTPSTNPAREWAGAYGVAIEHEPAVAGATGKLSSLQAQSKLAD
jgi:cytochrome c oxidase assembly protein subunit 15